MKEELVIVNGRPNEVFVNGDENADFTEHVKKRWKASPITKEPQYVAIHVKGKKSIRVIIEIDYKKSELDEGIIVAKGKPIRVNIPINRYGKDKLEKTRYTTFRKLITHETTDDL